MFGHRTVDTADRQYKALLNESSTSQYEFIFSLLPCDRVLEGGSWASAPLGTGQPSCLAAPHFIPCVLYNRKEVAFFEVPAVG